jgi:hypothetical protein
VDESCGWRSGGVLACPPLWTPFRGEIYLRSRARPLGPERIGAGIPFYVITLVMPFFPNDAMCCVAGLGKMSFRRFLMANILGRGITSFLTTIVGAYADRAPSLIWVFVAGFVAAGIFGWLASTRIAKASVNGS